MILSLRLKHIIFFQAEDGMRDIGVTGVQTCALPISGLVGIEQAFVGSGSAVQASTELLIGGAVTGSSGLRRGGEVLELRQQALRIGEQASDVIPDGGLKLLGLDVAAWAGGRASRHDAVLAVALVVPPLQLARGRPVGAAEHGEATG